MIVLGLSDIHGVVDPVRKLGKILKEADVVCLVGDITHFGGKAEADRVIDAVARYAARVLAVSGNCDYPGVDARLDEKKINLHGRVETIGGVAFLGLGGSLITPFNTPNEHTEDDVRRVLENAEHRIPGEKPLVVVSHEPPANTSCDRLSNGMHVGSAALYSFIETHRPAACLTGHIHEAVGTDRIGNTPIVNPGQLGRGRYARLEMLPDGVRVSVETFS